MKIKVLYFYSCTQLSQKIVMQVREPLQNQLCRTKISTQLDSYPVQHWLISQDIDKTITCLLLTKKGWVIIMSSEPCIAMLPMWLYVQHWCHPLTVSYIKHVVMTVHAQHPERFLMKKFLMILKVCACLQECRLTPQGLIKLL